LCLPIDLRVLKHLQVARVAVGESLVLSNGRGEGHELTLAKPLSRGARTREIHVKYEGSVRLDAARPQLTLVQGLAATDRMDLVVRQATELGVSRIFPLASARAKQRLDDEQAARKLARWRRIALAAAEQSGQLTMPEIRPPSSLTAALDATTKCASRVCCWEKSTTGSLAAAVQGTSAALFIGPEGGFSDEEVYAMQAAGVAVVSLGHTILRTETAAVVASALALSALGALAPQEAEAQATSNPRASSANLAPQEAEAQA
jgi:16S rRNA (uracil1498-N3)-methyltransferase